MNTATDKQKSFLRTLLAERAGVPAAEGIRAALNTARGKGEFTKAMASASIDALLMVAKAEQADGPAEAAYSPKKGDVHLVAGEYYRIHISQGTGNPYAVRANIISGARDGQPGTVEWEYEAGLIRKVKLNAATLVTAAQAARFGRMTGRCVFCSTAIDTPESTAVGYGPVCASKYGLPWGDTRTEVAAERPLADEIFDATAAMDAEELEQFEEATGLSLSKAHAGRGVAF